MRLSLSSLAYGLLLAQTPVSLAAPSGPDGAVDALFPRKAISANSIPATCDVLKHTKWSTIWLYAGDWTPGYANVATSTHAGSYALSSKKAHDSATVTYEIESKTARLSLVHSGKRYYLGIKPESSAGYYVANFWPSSLMEKNQLSYALCVQCTAGILQCFTESTGNQVYFLFSAKTGAVWATEKINLVTGRGGIPSGVNYGTLQPSKPLN